LPLISKVIRRSLGKTVASQAMVRRERCHWCAFANSIFELRQDKGEIFAPVGKPVDCFHNEDNEMSGVLKASP
jgi:hypothetical protein